MEEKIWDIQSARKNLMWFSFFAMIVVFLYDKIEEINFLNLIKIKDLEWYEIYLIILITLMWFLYRFWQYSLKSAEFNNPDRSLLLEYLIYWWCKVLDTKWNLRAKKTMNDNSTDWTEKWNKKYTYSEEDKYFILTERDWYKLYIKVIRHKENIIVKKVKSNVFNLNFELKNIKWNINITVEEPKLFKKMKIYLKYYFSETYYTDFKIPIIFWRLAMLLVLIRLLQYIICELY